MKKPLPIGVDNYNKRDESAYGKKALPIGIENFKTLVDRNAYYVDKTMVLRDLIDSTSMVTLFTRPRRFGKTLLQSMIRTFFEKEIGTFGDNTGKVIDNRHYFDGMKIMQAGEKYTSLQGQLPVISLSLKSAKQPNFELAYQCLKEGIGNEFKRHIYLLESGKLLESEREKIKKIIDGEAEDGYYVMSIKFLSDCLYKHFNKKVIILIDEYDVPLENAYFEGFYEQMISFIRSLFESALKTNDSLEFSVITGCLRISRESIFTGLNNLKIVSVLDNQYAEYFGFTPLEVEEMVRYYNIEGKREEIQDWYDGYLFGNTEVYNPWSVINYMDLHKDYPESFPKPYWSNTSSNSIIKDLVENADDETKEQIEELMNGGTIETPVHEEITYGDIHDGKDNIWNFLFFTGYLKKVSDRFADRTTFVSMKIPNEEIAYIYENIIMEWFRKKIEKEDMTELIAAIENADCEKMQSLIQEQLLETISYNDYNESYYHGFLAGILKCQKKYSVLSNRESGEGRFDIVLKEKKFMGKAYLLELKVARKFSEMKDAAEKALAQMDDKNYENDLYEEGYTVAGKYGIVFMKKGCFVKHGE